MFTAHKALIGAAAVAVLGACETLPGATSEVETAAAPSAEVLTADYRFRSAVNDREYRVSVILPPGYDVNGTSRHGVFYVYDGVGKNYEDFTQVSSLLGPQTPDVIWVGVGPGSDLTWDAARAADMTPTPLPGFDADTFQYIAQAAEEAGAPLSEQELAALPRSGDAAAFLSVLSEEIIPLIESAYRTNGDRTLGGHSFGGLFAGFVLLEQPELFDRYLISSPSFWWDDYMMIEREARVAEANDDLAARVFMSVGGAENEGMLRSKREFEAGLRARGYDSLVIETAEFDGADHMGAVIPAFMNGVPFLYAEE
ncbi:MAG: alpha/beta hydrolase-fold protein [Maricaulaceae bacterium]|jgi:predicted alpha/beta superfamily hydrolase